MLLLNLTLVLFALSFLTVWKFPPVLAIIALLLLDIAVLALMLQWSRRYLYQLIQSL
jgi:hypothetical protein